MPYGITSDQIQHRVQLESIYTVVNKLSSFRHYLQKCLLMQSPVSLRLLYTARIDSSTAYS